MTTLVHLVRHAATGDLGHVLSGRSDVALSSVGRAQAGNTARALAGQRPQAIHSSPRRRALETAQIIAGQAQVVVVDALDEVDFGEWTGASFAALANDPKWQRWNDARAQAAPPNGETMHQAVARAVAHVERSATPDSGPIVLVSHCDIIRGVVAHYLGLSLDRMLSFDCDPASISTLSVGDWGGRVVCLNERAA